jgi:hypothetical protein
VIKLSINVVLTFKRRIAKNIAKEGAMIVEDFVLFLKL